MHRAAVARDTVAGEIVQVLAHGILLARNPVAPVISTRVFLSVFIQIIPSRVSARTICTANPAMNTTVRTRGMAKV
jgi:hypothetical protein